MGKKIIELLRASLAKTTSFQIRGAPRALIYICVALTIATVVLYLAAWTWQWLTTRRPELAELTRFFGALTSASTVAAIGFFGRALIDSDDDGVPDAFEERKGNHDEK